MLCNPRISDMGEIGIDVSKGNKDKLQQIQFLQQVTEYMNPHIPVILHVRAGRSDMHSKSLYLEIVDICIQHCEKSQRVVLHCFTGDFTVANAWLSKFKNTYFGLTNLITSHDQKQLKAVRKIPQVRILVETDSPYMPPFGLNTYSPIYRVEVMEKIVTMRYTGIANISKWTTSINRFIFNHNMLK